VKLLTAEITNDKTTSETWISALERCRWQYSILCWKMAL